jgi:hypothetical protein
MGIGMDSHVRGNVLSWVVGGETKHSGRSEVDV